jgi:hypothetical protein
MRCIASSTRRLASVRQVAQIGAAIGREFGCELLVQDAAHGSLLRNARQQLHTRIAEALETHFPELMENQPERSKIKNQLNWRRDLADRL